MISTLSYFVPLFSLLLCDGNLIQINFVVGESQEQNGITQRLAGNNDTVLNLSIFEKMSIMTETEEKSEAAVSKTTNHDEILPSIMKLNVKNYEEKSSKATVHNEVNLGAEMSDDRNQEGADLSEKGFNILVSNGLNSQKGSREMIKPTEIQSKRKNLNAVGLNEANLKVEIPNDIVNLNRAYLSETSLNISVSNGVNPSKSFKKIKTNNEQSNLTKADAGVSNKAYLDGETRNDLKPDGTHLNKTSSYVTRPNETIIDQPIAIHMSSNWILLNGQVSSLNETSTSALFLNQRTGEDSNLDDALFDQINQRLVSRDVSKEIKLESSKSNLKGLKKAYSSVYKHSVDRIVRAVSNPAIEKSKTLKKPEKPSRKNVLEEFFACIARVRCFKQMRIRKRSVKRASEALIPPRQSCRSSDSESVEMISGEKMPSKELRPPTPERRSSSPNRQLPVLDRWHPTPDTPKTPPKKTRLGSK